MKTFVSVARAVSTAILLSGLAAAQSPAPSPQVEISNGIVRATLHLPDAERGYYQGTRFDWSGQIASLTYKNHNYFGKWFDRYDPKLHDAILGPVEEFQTNGAGLGYDDVKVGESFVRIGVGAVRKPEEPRYRQFNTYEITDPGKWTVKPFADRVEFTHDLTDTAGYAYRYTKIVRLEVGEPRLVLDHKLENTGKKPIETSVYEHNFYVIDGEPTGPGFSIKFPFDVRAARPLEGKAETAGKDVRFLRELVRRESVYTELEGFGATASDYDIRVENTTSGAGVRQTSDRPMSKLVLWSIRTTVCPEAYISMKIAPGESHTWRIAYDFYELPGAPAR